MKIAVTSTDGIYVNEHFGKAKAFYIYEVTDRKLTPVDLKKVNPYCESTTDGEPVNPDHEFAVDRFSLVYGEIKDCDVLYTQKIGDTPKKKLEELGVSVKLCNCPIEFIVGCSGDCN